MADKNITSIRPFLTVHDAEKAVEFYTAAFGAIEARRFEMPDQKISSVVEVENAVFYVADEEPENGNFSPKTTGQTPVRIILEIKDADNLFDNAIRLGATEICPMTTEENWRIGKLKDPFGHIWEIGFKLDDQASEV